MAASSRSQPTIAITGGTGVIGRHIVRQLLVLGCQVRLLTREAAERVTGSVDYILGDLSDRQAIGALLDGADYVVHCAGEKHNPDRMHQINTEASLQLMKAAINAKVKGFCHISSAGAVGATGALDIDESTTCKPTNLYEESKWQAEQGLLQLSQKSSLPLWILRPTNVVDSNDWGVLTPIKGGGLRSRLHLLLKGGERAHVVHASDVAAAVLHVMVSPSAPPGIYFVGCDEDDRNRFASLQAMLQSYPDEATSMHCYLPPKLHALIRKIRRGHSLHPKARFLSAKLRKTGFSFPMGIEGTIRELAVTADKNT